MSTASILLQLAAYGLSGGLLWHEIKHVQSPKVQKIVKITGIIVLIVVISRYFTQVLNAASSIAYFK